MSHTGQNYDTLANNITYNIVNELLPLPVDNICYCHMVAFIIWITDRVYDKTSMELTVIEYEVLSLFPQ